MSQIVTVMRRSKQRLKRLRHGRDPQRAEDAVEEDDGHLRGDLTDPLSRHLLQPSADDPQGGPADGEGPGDPLRDEGEQATLADPTLEASQTDRGLVNPGVPSGGRRLPKALLLAFEQVFARSLEHVRIHDGPDAARRADAIDAEAYTIGADIVLGRGLQGAALERILSHELTHVIQGEEGRLPSTGDVLEPHHPVEREAYANESTVMRQLQVAKRATASQDQGQALARVSGEQQGAPQAKLQRTLPGVLRLVDAALAIWGDLTTDPAGEVDALGHELRGLIGDLATSVAQWAQPVLDGAADPTTVFAWADALVAELSGVVPELSPLLDAVAEASLLDVLLDGRRAVSSALGDANWQPADLLDSAPPKAATRGNVFDDDPMRAAHTERVLGEMSAKLGADAQNIEVHADALGQQRTAAQGAIGLMDQGVIYLDPTYYDPTTMPGVELLAHEVAHVFQSANPATEGEQAGALAEQEADSWAADFAMGTASGGLEQGLPTDHVAAKTKAKPVQVDSKEEGNEQADAKAMADNGETDCECDFTADLDGAHDNDEDSRDPESVPADDVATTSSDTEETPDGTGVPNADQNEQTVAVDSGEPAEAEPAEAVEDVDGLVSDTEEQSADIPEEPASPEEMAARLAEAQGVIASVSDGSLLGGVSIDLIPPSFELTGDEEADADSTMRAQGWEQQSESLLAGFIGTQSMKLAEFVGITATIDERMNAALEAAISNVQAAVANQQAALRAHIEGLRARATNEAQTLKTTIDGAHDTAITSITATTEAGHAWNQSLLDGNLAIMDAALITQQDRIRKLYESNHQLYLQAGRKAAGQARKIGNAHVKRYAAQKIHRRDSILDGYLTDNRCEARMDAAKAVAKGYAEALFEEAETKANEAKKNIQQDLDGAAKLHTEATGLLRQSAEAVDDQLENQKTASLAATEQSRQGLHTAVDGLYTDLMASLDEFEEASCDLLQSTGRRTIQALRDNADKARFALTELAANTAKGLAEALQSMADSLNGYEAPDPVELEASLSEAEAAIEGKLAEITATIHGGLDTAQGALNQTASNASQALAKQSQQACTVATEKVDAFTEGLAKIGEANWNMCSELSISHSTLMTTTMNDASTAYQTITDGLNTGFTQLSENIETGAKRNAEGLEKALLACANDEMPGKIRTEANKAAAKVQPAWKSVLKWVLIIAIIVVCAVFLGPFVVGLATGAAAAMGAGATAAAIIGGAIGGAIVGAVSSASIQLVSNWADGKELTDGLWESTWKGALTGLIGGGVGGYFNVNTVSVLKELSITVGVDVAVDTAIAFGQGTMSWENFGITALSSIVMNGAGHFILTKPKVDANKKAGVDVFGKSDVDPTVKVGGDDPNVKVGGDDTTVKPGGDDTTVKPGGDNTTVKPGGDNTTVKPGGDNTTVKPGGDDVGTNGGGTKDAGGNKTTETTTKVDDNTLPAGTKPKDNKPLTGAELAKKKGLPDAPEGYVYVRKGTDDVYIRRKPGKAQPGPNNKRQIELDGKGFKDRETGQEFSTAKEVDDYNDVLKKNKQDRPDPEDYIPTEKIKAHLEGFEDGASYLTPKEFYDKFDALGREDGLFVMRKDQMDSLMAKTKGDIGKIEKELGIPEGSWKGKEMVRVDIDDPSAHNLRMPTGKEAGANDEWLPGGKLPTGQDEAVLNSIPKADGNHSVSDVGAPKSNKADTDTKLGTDDGTGIVAKTDADEPTITNRADDDVDTGTGGATPAKDKWSREPKSLQDRMTLEQAKNGQGEKIISDLNDPRYKGMEKWEFKTKSDMGRDSVVHYVRDPKTGELMDFKFKKHSTDKPAGKNKSNKSKKSKMQGEDDGLTRGQRAWLEHTNRNRKAKGLPLLGKGAIPPQIK